MKLDTSEKRYLTRETKDAQGNVSTTRCDIDGNPIGDSAMGVPVYQDIVTGKFFARVAVLLPSDTDAKSLELKESILARKPEWFASDDGEARGWYVPAPDYTVHAVAA